MALGGLRGAGAVLSRPFAHRNGPRAQLWAMSFSIWHPGLARLRNEKACLVDPFFEPDRSDWPTAALSTPTMLLSITDADLMQYSLSLYLDMARHEQPLALSCYTGRETPSREVGVKTQDLPATR